MKQYTLGTQIFLTSLLIAIFAIVTVTWYASDIGREFYLEKTAQALSDNAYLIKQLLEPTDLQNAAELQKKINHLSQNISIRITIIDSLGTVMADSEKEPSIMDNHGTRPEILEAFKKQHGRSIRFSDTVKRNMMYFAIYVQNTPKKPFFIRTSKTLSVIEETINEMQSKIFIAGIFMTIVAILVGFFVTRRLTIPLEKIILGVERFARGDFSKRLTRTPTKEMAQLSASLNEMADQINEKIETITRQKKEQNAVLESMAEGVIAIDHNGIIIWINAAAYKLFTIEKPTVKGDYIRNALDNIQIENLFLNVLKTGEAQEEEISISNHKEMHLKVSTQVLVDDIGNVIGALMVINDLTRLRHLEQGRREFVANVSHELRTPLTTIKGFAEALHDGEINDKENAMRFTEIIFRQSTRLGNILEDILTLSRLDQEEGAREIDLIAEDVHAIINSAIQMCQFNADQKNIQIHQDNNCDQSIPMSRQLIEEALVNLIDNAIKYSAENTIINISCTTEDDNLLICVSDQGNGISPEHLSRIFERFYRVDKARSRKEGGTGLGLAIVKHIALVHKGHVEVESTEGVGSTFKLYLPL